MSTVPCGSGSETPLMTPRRLVVGLGLGLVLLALGVAWGVVLWAWLG